MSEITINTISGLTPPYSVYVCNVYGVYCEFIGVTTTTPTTIVLPPAFDSAPIVGIKIIDSTGCERFKLVECLDLSLDEKEFQNGDTFYFMDYEIYQFQ